MASVKQEEGRNCAAGRVSPLRLKPFYEVMTKSLIRRRLVEFLRRRGALASVLWAFVVAPAIAQNLVLEVIPLKYRTA